MFVRTKIRKNGKVAVQIVSAHRKANHVSQRVIRHIGQGSNEFEVEEFKKLGQAIIHQMENEKTPLLPLYDPIELNNSVTTKKKKDVPDNVKLKDVKEEQRINDGITDIFGALYDNLGFNTIIRRTLKNEQWNSYLRTMVIARIANPVSKHRTASLLEEDFGIKLPLQQIYRTLDHLQRCETDVKKHTASKTLELFKQEVEVLFFDVTTLYFESFEEDELREFGFSKDGKFKETQVVLALVTTKEGMPISYRLFPGSTYEGHTLLSMVEELSNDYQVKQIMLVADRAMFTNDNLKKLESKGIKYIVAAKLKGMKKNVQEEILSSQSYRAEAVDDELCWVNEQDMEKEEGRRLIVEYSPKRAKKDASDRDRLIERLLKKAKEGKIPIKSLIPNYGSKKYLKVNDKEKAELNNDKIEKDSEWDGLHGVITNVSKEEMDVRGVLSRYRDLWCIESAFRVNKHDLKMRPIFHFKKERIQAHIALCYIAYAVVKHAMYHLKKQDIMMSFEQLRNELLHVQSSVLVDIQTNEMYMLPSKISQLQRKIYSAFGLIRRDSPYIFE